MRLGGFSAECEGGEVKSGSKVTSTHVGLQGITAGDEAQTAWPGPGASVVAVWLRRFMPSEYRTGIDFFSGDRRAWRTVACLSFGGVGECFYQRGLFVWHDTTGVGWVRGNESCSVVLWFSRLKHFCLHVWNEQFCDNISELQERYIFFYLKCINTDYCLQCQVYILAKRGSSALDLRNSRLTKQLHVTVN